MYETHPLMVIDACAKYGKPMSKHTNVTGWTQKYDKKPINLTFVKGQCQTTLHLKVIDAWSKYGKRMSNQKIVISQTRKHVKNLINLT